MCDAYSCSGEGDVDFPAIFGILHEADFDEWLSLEAGGPPEAESVVRGIDYIKQTCAATTE